MKSFLLTLVPIQGGTDEDNHVSVHLACKYTPKYPDEKADISIQIVKGLKECQRKELEQLVDRCQEENIGMPCVYSLTDVVNEYLLNNNRPAGDGSIHSEMLERQRLKAEAKSITHLLTHMPMNPYCEACQRAKMQRRRAPRWRRRRTTPSRRRGPHDCILLP